MKQYKDWSPTPWDCKGLNAGDKSEWYVAPVIKTRDSDCLERANYDSLLNELTTHCHVDDYEELGFNHWGPGWIEIIIVRPMTSAHLITDKAELSLMDYPVYDEELFSEYECQAEAKDFANYLCHDLMMYYESVQDQYELGEIYCIMADLLTEDDLWECYREAMEMSNSCWSEQRSPYDRMKDAWVIEVDECIGQCMQGLVILP